MNQKWIGFIIFVWVVCMFMGTTFEKHTEAAGTWGGTTGETTLEYLMNIKHISYQESETGELHFVFFNKQYFDTLIQVVTWDFTFLRGRKIAEEDRPAIVDSGSTTTLRDAILTENDNWWNGATLTILTTTDGLAPEGERKTVRDFIAATDELQFSALSAPVEGGDTYDVRSGQGYEMVRWIVLVPFSIAAAFGLLYMFIQLMQGFIRI